MRNQGLHRVVLTATMAAVMGILAQVRFNVGPVPYTMQNMGVVLASLLLPPLYSALSVAVYLLLIFLGFPLASGFSGGPIVLLGYTGGYLWGFLIAAPLFSWLSRRYLSHRGISISDIGTKDVVALLGLSAISFIPVYFLGFIFFYHYALGSSALLEWSQRASSLILEGNSRLAVVFAASVLIFLPQDLLMDHLLGIYLARESSRLLREKGVEV